MRKQKQKTNVFEMVLDMSGERNIPVTAQPSVRDPYFSEEWVSDQQEGQLAIDVMQTPTDIVVVSTIAGALTDRLEVFVHDDLLTIRGMRENPLDKTSPASYVHQECFWGKFSRTVVMPVHVKGDQARAEYKNGVLIVHIPKRSKDVQIPVELVD